MRSRIEAAVSACPFEVDKALARNWNQAFVWQAGVQDQEPPSSASYGRSPEANPRTKGRPWPRHTGESVTVDLEAVLGEIETLESTLAGEEVLTRQDENAILRCPPLRLAASQI